MLPCRSPTMACTHHLLPCLSPLFLFLQTLKPTTPSLPPSLPLADRVAKLKSNGESKQKNVRKTKQKLLFFFLNQSSTTTTTTTTTPSPPPSLPLLPDWVGKLWSYGTKEFYENPTHPKQNRKRETTRTNQDFSSTYLLLLLLLEEHLHPPAVKWPVCNLDEVHLFFTNGYTVGWSSSIIQTVWNWVWPMGWAQNFWMKVHTDFKKGWNLNLAHHALMLFFLAHQE